MTSDPRYIAAAVVGVVLIAAVMAWPVYKDQPATDAGKSMRDAAAKTAEMARTPRPVEYAPPVAEQVPGDGYFVVGRDMKRGTYRGAGGLSCYWARIQGGAGATWYAESSLFVPGPQVVVLGKGDVFFASLNCGPWVMVP